jgi:hypothetical protein
MGKTTGFKEFKRVVEPYRPAKERVLDFKEIYTEHDENRRVFTPMSTLAALNIPKQDPVRRARH